MKDMICRINHGRVSQTFFQVAGMKRVEVPKDEQLEREINELETFGFRRELLASKGESLKILSHLEREDLENPPSSPCVTASATSTESQG